MINRGLNEVLIYRQLIIWMETGIILVYRLIIISMNSLLRADTLSKTFRDRKVVKDVSLDIIQGNILAFLGPNGAGKSTVINMLTGQLTPSSGQIVWQGESYEALPERYRSLLGIMPQEVVLWESLTTEENLRLAATLHKMPQEKISSRIDDLIETLHLEKERKTLAGNLSGGYKRRLHLAVSIVHDPDIIFLDEPSPGIDPQSRRLMWDYIQSLRDQGKAILLTDHYLEEAEALADYVHILDDGQVIASGTVPELQHQFGEGDIIVIRLSDEATASEIQQMLADDYSQTQLVDCTVTIFTEQGGKEISQILQQCEPLRDKIEEISLKHPSLEDIFLLLTGREVRD